MPKGAQLVAGPRGNRRGFPTVSESAGLNSDPTGQTERGSSTHVGVLVRAHPAQIAVPVVLVRLAAPECGSAPCL